MNNLWCFNKGIVACLGSKLCIIILGLHVSHSLRMICILYNTVIKRPILSDKINIVASKTM